MNDEQETRRSDSAYCQLPDGDSEALFRQVADIAPVMIWFSGLDASCFWFNKPWLDFTGRTLEQETGEGWLQNVHPEDQPRCWETYTAAFNSRETFTMEYRLRRHDGTYCWLLDNGVPRHGSGGEFLGFIGTRVDITSRRETEQALQASEERLRMLVESATEFAIFTCNGEGIIRSWSEGAERVFGYAEEEILGQPMAILFTPEDRAAGVPDRELEVARGHGKSFDDRWHVRKDGSQIFAAGAVSPIRGSDPVCFVKIARDLTERKRMEDTLKEADLKKNRFIATLAHELRNPLAPIRTGLEIMRDPKAPDAAKATVLGIMERQMDQVVYLVDDLMEISRIAEGKIILKLELVDLGQITRLATENCRPEAESKGHELLVSIPSKPVPIRGDAVRIEQVIVNLLTNAIKYTRQKGRIQIAVACEQDQVVLRVKDNGIGIPQDKLTEVFEVFNQISHPGGQSSGGLGIGLSVVKSMVEMHGGVVTADSLGPDAGSEFTVRIPLVRDSGETGNEAEALTPAAAPTATGGRRVLIVDDNCDAALMLQSALASRGYDVRVVFSGSTALAEARDTDPHICICDIGLPDISGHEVARLLAASHPGIQLISISGWGQEADHQKSFEAGFVHHLVKPVRLDDLLESLDPPSKK